MPQSLKASGGQESCFKDHCLRVAMWLALLLGFAIICVGLPLVAFSL